MWTFLLCFSCTVQDTPDQTSTDIAAETVVEITDSTVKTYALTEEKPHHHFGETVSQLGLDWMSTRPIPRS